MTCKCNKDEQLKELQDQNSFWSTEYSRVESDNLELRIFLMATTLAAIFGCSWVISDLIGIIQW